jgi:hypothetical protein
MRFQVNKRKADTNKDRRDLSSISCKYSIFPFMLQGARSPKGKSEQRCTQIYKVLV